MFKHNSKNAADRLGSAPQKLISYGEAGQIVGADIHFMNSAHRHGQRAGNRSRRQVLKRFLFGVRQQP